MSSYRVPLLTKREAAARAGVSLPSIAKYIAEYGGVGGKLRRYIVGEGRRLRFRETAVPVLTRLRDAGLALRGKPRAPRLIPDDGGPRVLLRLAVPTARPPGVSAFVRLTGQRQRRNRRPEVQIRDAAGRHHWVPVTAEPAGADQAWVAELPGAPGGGASGGP